MYKLFHINSTYALNVVLCSDIKINVAINSQIWEICDFNHGRISPSKLSEKQAE